ncbi:uncharacterized protein BO95DRAFT_443568 [Aspergillus brunneoviolaceus CBS 621.78]|uniref:Uncharacterized protein n=1 Tax=Aspergillus brunneoviolaceus CBS 621.78 TaxID=1450534 RepID=A0ACD1G7B6_9EURO|nr:hypothetical protein BO95DRAFT_443568 [Aspergillus brunneoviolaceus CBS 621.78]RAH45107.1 hypothetical protein BO95DRAFT_443568 [Aspergillus brunneoviolaceus CBS 621.78]
MVAFTVDSFFLFLLLCCFLCLFLFNQEHCLPLPREHPALPSALHTRLTRSWFSCRASKLSAI